MKKNKNLDTRTERIEDKLMEAREMLAEMRERGDDREDSNVLELLKEVVGKSHVMSEDERQVLIDFAADYLKTKVADYLKYMWVGLPEDMPPDSQERYYIEEAAMSGFLDWVKKQ